MALVFYCLSVFLLFYLLIIDLMYKLKRDNKFKNSTIQIEVYIGYSCLNTLAIYTCIVHIHIFVYILILLRLCQHEDGYKPRPIDGR